MTSTALARADHPLAPPTEELTFAFSDLRVFTSIPAHHHDIIAFRGAVLVFCTDFRCCHETVEEGALYVRESQRPAANMLWESWLRLECEEAFRYRNHCPRSPLKIVREVVQAVRWPRRDAWALRLASGFVDGPYKDWAFGTDLVGKIVGVYRPN